MLVWANMRGCFLFVSAAKPSGWMQMCLEECCCRDHREVRAMQRLEGSSSLPLTSLWASKQFNPGPITSAPNTRVQTVQNQKLLTAHTARKPRWRSRCPAPESCRPSRLARAAPRPRLDLGPGDTTLEERAPTEKPLRYCHLPRPWPQPLKPGSTQAASRLYPPSEKRKKKNSKLSSGQEKVLRGEKSYRRCLLWPKQQAERSRTPL